MAGRRRTGGADLGVHLEHTQAEGVDVVIGAVPNRICMISKGLVCRPGLACRIPPGQQRHQAQVPDFHGPLVPIDIDFVAPQVPVDNRGILRVQVVYAF